MSDSRGGPLVHAPDGAMIPGALCERDGDTTVIERDVTCPDCLDELESHPYHWKSLTRTTSELRAL